MPIFAFAEGSPIQLVPDGTIFIHIALILLMIYVLNRTFFRPINRVIESREKNKGGHSGEALEILREVQEKQAKYESALLQARSEGYDLIEKERAKALKKKEQKISEAKEAAEVFYREKIDDLEKQTDAARQVIAAEAEKMAEKISSNILKV
jgi:F-type H+-transporting ATPase subunit b